MSMSPETGGGPENEFVPSWRPDNVDAGPDRTTISTESIVAMGAYIDNVNAQLEEAKAAARSAADIAEEARE